jgi:ATP synthase protein I
MSPGKKNDLAQEDTTATAAQQAAERAEAGKHDPEPSLGTRFGQIGVLGWATVAPILIGLIIGRYLDRLFSTGIMFAAAFIMIGAVVGMWSAWKWMHRT